MHDGSQVFALLGVKTYELALMTERARVAEARCVTLAEELDRAREQLAAIAVLFPSVSSEDILVNETDMCETEGRREGVGDADVPSVPL